MDEQTLDLRDIIKTLKKRSKLILGTFLTFTIIALLVSFMIPPTYESETNLRIKQPKGLANSLLADLPTGTGNTKQLMSTYAEILKSRTVVQEVIEKTQSAKEKPPTYEAFLATITTVPVKDTEILKLKVKAKSPQEAQFIADTLVDTFLGRMTDLVRSEQKTVREFIGQRLQDSKKELDKAETALQQYKNEQKIVAPQEETKAMVEKLAAVYKLSAENVIALSAAQAKLSNAQRQLGNQKQGFVADSPLVQQHKGKLADLEVQLVSLLRNYTEQHPQVAAVKAAAEETRAKLNQEIARIASADAPSANPIHIALLQSKLQAEAEIAIGSAQRQAIDQVIAGNEKELGNLPVKEQGLGRVMRDAMVAQELYVMLMKRHEEARISEVMQPTDVQVIDVANLPERPIAPRKALNTMIAAILGLFLGTVVAFALEYMNKTIRTADDVEQYLGLPVLGSIPIHGSDAKPPSTSFITKITGLIKEKQQHRHQRSR